MVFNFKPLHVHVKALELNNIIMIEVMKEFIYAKWKWKKVRKLVKN